MAVKIRSSRALGTLNLTPLIDVVFLLLVFFLVATRFAEEDRELDVLLPSASEAAAVTAESNELAINISETGSFYVGGKTVNEAGLLAILNSASSNNPLGQTVIIRADQRVPFQFVTTAMNLCNLAGIHDYTIATDGE
ncbi:MAG: biopolymer transporter ExbD [Planctomycetota bacterium]|nr:biopolymer transporter ExbD [Planctomycetota bacterium]